MLGFACVDADFFAWVLEGRVCREIEEEEGEGKGDEKEEWD